MTQLQSHLSRGGFFSFQKNNRSQMVLSIKMKWPYIIIVLINEEARIWNKVLSKCCQNAFFAKKLRFVSAQEKEKALSLGLFYGCGGTIFISNTDRDAYPV
jgi:hypothetical protein